MSQGSTTEKKYDIVVYGATGFTGKLLAEYITRTYGVTKQLKWAIAGRSKTALEVRSFVLRTDETLMAC